MVHMLATKPIEVSTPPSPTSTTSANDEESITSTKKAPSVDQNRLTPLDDEKIIQQLHDCDAIRYAAYRTAMKVDVIQQALKLNSVKMAVASNVFQHHGLHCADNETVLENSKASDVISDIFFATSKSRGCHSLPMDVPALTAASLRFVMKIFDPKSKHAGVFVKSLKMFFVVFTSGKLREKFMYLFRIFADASGKNLLSKGSLRSLLGTLVKIADFFGESQSFGVGLLEGSIAQCFGRFSSEFSGMQTLTEESFSRWLLMEPQIMVWMPTHFRLVSAKGVRHGIRCKSCKMEDIIGMRYQCLRCLKYDLCQHCFFYGQTNRGHRLEHPMQEYCYRSSRYQSTKAFLKLMLNNIKKKKLSQVKPRYLSPAANIEEKSGSDASSGFHSEASSSDTLDNLEAFNKIPDNCAKVAFDPGMNHTVVRYEGNHIISQHQEIFNSIVLHMEENNKQMLENLKRQMENEPSAVDPKLDNCVSMQVQLNRLKSLMDAIFSSSLSNHKHDNANGVHDIVESTPVLSHPRVPGVFNVSRDFSPIVRGNIKTRMASPIASGSSIANPSPPKTGIMTNGTITRSLRRSRKELEQTYSDSTVLPNLTEMSMADLSSLLVKTGKIDPNLQEDLNQYNITENLNSSGAMDVDINVMEELETLMLKLDQVFHAFHGHTSSTLLRRQKSFSQSPKVIADLISEMSDQIHNFTYQFTLDHEM